MAGACFGAGLPALGGALGAFGGSCGLCFGGVGLCLALGGRACSWACFGLQRGYGFGCGVCGVGVWGVWCRGVGRGSGSCPFGVKGRKGWAGLFFAFIVVLVGGLRFFLARLAGWSWLVFFAFPRALRGWGEKTLSSLFRQGLRVNHRILNHRRCLQKKSLPSSLRPRLSFLLFALPSSGFGLGVCDFSWFVWLVGRGLPPALFPVPCGAGGLGAFIVVSAGLLGSSSCS